MENMLFYVYTTIDSIILYMSKYIEINQLDVVVNTYCKITRH